MNLQPTLSGKLLTLRPLLAGDFEALYAVASDPLIWAMHPENTRYKRDVFERFFQAALESKGALIACDLATREVIGSSRFNAWKPEAREIEIGYTFLARRTWGLGFNREMKTLMLDHAFRDVDRVLFYIGESNLRSQKAIEKIGARLIDRIARVPKEGAPYTAVVYALDQKPAI